MRKRAAIALLALVVFALGIVLWPVLFPRRYNGKTEREWIRSLDPPATPLTPLATSPTSRIEQELIRFGEQKTSWAELGSNAVPILLDALQTKQGWSQRIYSNLWSKLTSKTRKYCPAPLNYSNVHQEAASLLIFLDTQNDIPVDPLVSALEDDAKVNVLALLNTKVLKKHPAGKEKILPAILRATQDPDPMVRSHAVVALQYFPEDMPKMIPVFWKLFGDTDPKVRIEAAKTLYNADPVTAEKAGVAAVAEKCAKSTGYSAETYEMASFLEAMARESNIAIGALQDGLSSPDASIRLLAADRLGTIGTRAKAAIHPLLKVSREDPDREVRETARDALKRISPEEAAKLQTSP